MQAQQWSLMDVLKWTTERFAKAQFSSPRLDAEILVATALQTTRVGLYTHFDKPLGEDEKVRVRELVKRRLAGEPVAYLVGEKEFWSLPFAVDSRVLIPRPDTETLVQTALELARASGAGRIVDVGTGSGAVAVVLTKELPEAQVIATDVSEGALEIAAGNAQRHDVAERVQFVLGDLLAPVEAPVELVVSNLPYIPSGDMAALSAEVKREPAGALDGGEEGLALIERLVNEAWAKLVSGGALVMEHGFDQGERVRALLTQAGYETPTTVRDLAGHPRVTHGRKPS